MGESDVKGMKWGQHKPKEDTTAQRKPEVPYYAAHLHPLLKAAGYEPRYLTGGHLLYDGPHGYLVRVSAGGFHISRAGQGHLEGPNDPKALKQALDQLQSKKD
jgi:hypothetical protein